MTFSWPCDLYVNYLQNNDRSIHINDWITKYWIWLVNEIWKHSSWDGMDESLGMANFPCCCRSCWARSQPMTEDIIYIMSSLLGYHLAQSQGRVRVKTRTPINIKVVSYQYRNTHYIKRWSRSHRWLSAVTPLLKHWSYCSLGLSHPCNLYNGNSCSWRHFKTEKGSRFRGSPEYFFPCGVVTVLAIHPNCILN